MANLLLTKGYRAIVDEADWEWLSQMKWTALVTGENIKRVYAYRRVDWDNSARRWRNAVYLHRLITGCGAEFDVDHINGDTLDNRRCNLRIATRSQNLANNRRAAGRSGYRGVTRESSIVEKWRVQFRGKSYGVFATPEEAARVYDKLALENFGEFARLNFPEIRSVTD